MRFIRILAAALLICAAVYLAALYLNDPRCTFDGNPFDCDDDFVDLGTVTAPDAD